MAFTDSQVRQLKAKLDPQTYKDAKRQWRQPQLRRGMARHRRGQSHLRLRRLGSQNRLNRLRVERSKRAVSWSRLHRQSAGQRARRRDYNCAGGLRNGGRQSFNPGASTRACSERRRDRRHQAGACHLWQPIRACPLRPRAGRRAQDARCSGIRESSQIGPWVLRSSTGKPVSSHDTAKSFVEALKQAMSEAHDIELLYDVWEQNIETLRVLHRSTNERPGIVPTMVSHLRACAVDLVKRASNGSAHAVGKGNGWHQHKIDKSVLTISEPKRIRCKEHLRFVASQPCLICGRVPSHAHHVRYAQSQGSQPEGER